MNKNTKKIIAKEFLFLLGTTILFFVVLFAWTMLSDSNSDRKYEIKQEITELTQANELPYRLRVFYFVNKDILNNSSWNKMEDSGKFISDLKTDPGIVSSIYSFIKENDSGMTITEEEFKEKVRNDKESETYLTKITSLEKELEKTKASIFSGSVGDDEILGLGLTLFSIFFLLRYLIYATKWSVKELKQ